MNGGIIIGNTDNLHEIMAAWENSRAVEFKGVTNYRILTEYNDIVLAARIDKNNEFEFVTWRYDYARTGFDHGNYYDDYNAAKENFVTRSGLISKDRILPLEKDAEIDDDYEIEAKTSDISSLIGQLGEKKKEVKPPEVSTKKRDKPAEIGGDR